MCLSPHPLVSPPPAVRPVPAARLQVCSECAYPRVGSRGPAVYRSEICQTELETQKFWGRGLERGPSKHLKAVMVSYTADPSQGVLIHGARDTLHPGNTTSSPGMRAASECSAPSTASARHVRKGSEQSPRQRPQEKAPARPAAYTSAYLRESCVRTCFPGILEMSDEGALVMVHTRPVLRPLPAVSEPPEHRQRAVQDGAHPPYPMAQRGTPGGLCGHTVTFNPKPTHPNTSQTCRSRHRQHSSHDSRTKRRWLSLSYLPRLNVTDLSSDSPENEV